MGSSLKVVEYLTQSSLDSGIEFRKKITPKLAKMSSLLWLLCALNLVVLAFSIPIDIMQSGRVESVGQVGTCRSSILCQSLLPASSGAPFITQISVESPALILKRPSNLAAKRQQVAERRIAEESITQYLPPAIV